MGTSLVLKWDVALLAISCKIMILGREISVAQSLIYFIEDVFTHPLTLHFLDFNFQNTPRVLTIKSSNLENWAL